MSASIAKFNLGDRVRHIQHGYLAVVIDVDPIFQASGRLNPRATRHSFATRNPWYRLLVDESSQITYVEETKLIPEKGNISIDNPHIAEHLRERRDGYQSTVIKH